MSRPARTVRFRALALSAVCAVSLGVVACGDDEEPTATTPVGVTAESSSTEAQGNFTEALATQLETAGVPQDQIDCVTEELEGTLSEQDIVAAENASASGEVPQEIIDQSLEAAGNCIGGQ